MMKYILLLLVAFIQITFAYSQNTFRAIIKDAETNEPLVGASAVLEGATIGSSADVNGLITIPNIPNGRQVILFSFVGYQTLKDTFDFPMAMTEPVTIGLSSEGEELEEIVVTSTRSSRTIEDIPTRIEAISGEELDEKSNMRPGDIRMQLNESTGIQLQQTSATTANANIRIQGLDGRYTQMLQDGMPLYSGFSAGLSILQIPPLNLRQIEIIKGSASTLYGGGAIAGLINLITKAPTEERELSFMVNGTTARGLDLSGFYGEKFGKIGITLFTASNSQREYDPNGNGFTAIPRYQRYTVSPNLYFYFNPTTTLNIGLNTSFEDRKGGDIQVIKGQSDDLHQYFERNQSDRLASQLQFDKSFGKNTFTLKNSISYFDRAINLPNYNFGGKQWSSFSEASYLLSGEKMEWIGGLNLWTEQFTEDGNQEVFSREYKYTTLGAFLQNNWKAAEWLNLETGLRTDYHNEYGAFVLPRLSALVKITENLSSRIGGGLGYKAPTIFTEEAETASFRNVRPIDIRNSQAETSLGGNFDINYRTVLFNELTFSVNQLLFYTRLNHALILNNDSLSQGIYQFENANGLVDSRGIETNIKLGYADFKLFAGYSLVDTKRRYNEPNSPIPLTAKHRVNLVLMYEVEGKFRIGYEAYYTGRKYLSTGESSRPYWLMGVMAEKKWKHFSLFINFENILDIRQNRYEQVVQPPFTNPTFREVWAPLEGFIANGGFKVML